MNRTPIEPRVPAKLVGIFLLLTTLGVTVPFLPSFPVSGNDAYKFATNQAVADGLVFGREFVFTSGPYAAVRTRLYHPATDRLMMVGSTTFGLCYGIALVLLTWRTPWRLPLIGVLACTFLLVRSDALFYSYPLLLMIAVYRATLPDGLGWRLPRTGVSTAAIVALFVALGLLPLVKGSFLAPAASASGASAWLFWHKRRTPLAGLAVVVPIVAGIAFWIGAGQPLEALPEFFRTTAAITFGYSDGMALPGPRWEVVAYLAASAAILYALARKATDPVSSRAFACVAYTTFLFVSFKAGFVRHDAHALTAGTAILLAGLSLGLLRRRSIRTVVVLISSLFTWAYIDHNYPDYGRTGLATLYANGRDIYVGAVEGLRIRWRHPRELEDRFRASLEAIRTGAKISVLEGTTDIYPFDQALLLAAGVAWRPRPVIYSFFAYTPGLARLNEQHLRGRSAPRNVVFQVEPIDGHLPTLEDGPSWPTLLANYSLVDVANERIYFREKSPSRVEPAMAARSRDTHALGEAVALPETEHLLFAEIAIGPSLLGRVRTLFYKPSRLSIGLELADGRVKTYPMPAGMAAAGFILSPLIEDTRALAALAREGAGALRSSRVVTVRVSSPASSFDWRPAYQLALFEIH
jgi:hypothetical protein